MSVLKSYFNYNVKQSCNSVDDYLMSSEVTEEGNIIDVPKRVNYKKIQEQNGNVTLWKYDNMIRAGVNPKAFNIHTGKPTAGEGLNDVKEAIADFEEKTKGLTFKPKSK